MKSIFRTWTALALAAAFLASSMMTSAATSGTTTKKAATTKTTKAVKKPAAQTASKAAPRAGIARNPYIGAIVMDAVTGQVLIDDQSGAKAYPASVLKLMDLLIILEKIEAGQLSYTNMVGVSAKAAKTGGSQVWLAENETFTLDDMLYALMIQSANDSAVALAEKVAGSTEGMVALMNQKAQSLGMTSTLFQSVHGLPPSAGQQQDVTTPRDFAILCRELLKHRDALRYTSTRERPFRTNVPDKTVIMQTHNHLLGQVDGCDGLKTGFTATAGYSIAATAARNGQRVICVVMGSQDRKTRDAKATELINKGFTLLASQPRPAAVAAPAAAPMRTNAAAAPVKR